MYGAPVYQPPGCRDEIQLETDKKDTIAVFFLKNGNIQMYTLPHDHSDPCVAELTMGEARRLGTILTGAIMEADQESVEIAFSALSELGSAYIPISSERIWREKA